MDISVKGIQDLKTYYVTKLYIGVRKEQREDDTFYKDTFQVPLIKNPIRISRTGAGRELIDSPVAQISACQMFAFRHPLKDTKPAQDSALDISRLINEQWIARMMRRNPTPLQEFVKNLFLRGEAWLHPIHNENWVLPPYEKEGLPVLSLIPDPMVIYASPNEDENGIPEHVIVWYERLPWIVEANYPAWTNPNHAGEPQQKETVEWLEYWDKDVRYFEADGEPVLQGGIQENVYGFVPFVHKLSGFGKESPEGKMEDLVVGRLRAYRDLLKRDCAITSDIDTTMHLFANKSIDVQGDDQHPVPEGFADAYEMGTGIVHELPPGITVTPSVDKPPGREAFEYLYSVRADVGKKLPAAFTGGAVGASGRMQDIAYQTAMKQFEGIVRATEYAFETALGMGLRMINGIPELMPNGISKADISDNYEVKIELKADDPIEADRKAMLGSRLYQQGEIDLMTNLVEYQGYTAEKADEVITNILVEKVTFGSPEIAQLLGLSMADKMGMLDEIIALRQQAQQLGGQGMMPTPSPTEAKRAGGEVKTPTGVEMLDAYLGGYGARTPPSPYTRET